MAIDSRVYTACPTHSLLLGTDMMGKSSSKNSFASDLTAPSNPRGYCLASLSIANLFLLSLFSG